MTQQLPDFGEMGAQIKAREEAEQQAAALAEAQRAREIERVTNRTFKGIMPRPFRVIFLKQQLARAQRESAGGFDSPGGENE
jgi:hypothetical protein